MNHTEPNRRERTIYLRMVRRVGLNRTSLTTWFIRPCTLSVAIFALYNNIRFTQREHQTKDAPIASKLGQLRLVLARTTQATTSTVHQLYKTSQHPDIINSTKYKPDSQRCQEYRQSQPCCQSSSHGLPTEERQSMS